MSDFGDDDDGFGSDDDDLGDGEGDFGEGDGDGDDFGEGDGDDQGAGDDFGDGDGQGEGGDGDDFGDGDDGQGEGGDGDEPPPPSGPATDDTIFGSAEDYPDASNEDFEDDPGDWSEGDYAEAAGALFGQHEHFGEHAVDRWADEGYYVAPDAGAYSSYVDRVAPGQAESLAFMVHDGHIVPRGFITTAALLALRAALPYVDWSEVDVTVPRRGGASEPFTPRPLPPELAGVDVRDTVDLRPYCSPVGDQGATSRCAAFAWVHAIELLYRMLGHATPELSCSFAMLQFQRRQGENGDYGWAFEGGEGTMGSWEPGALLAERGTCTAAAWPNDEPVPRASWEHMVAEAPGYRLPAKVSPIALDDMKRVLSAGCPVQISITTGPMFADVGRDGVVRVAEGASGRHGYHAMLCVGYVGNYFIVKNSWGDDWGDRGYCYLPKKVIADSEPELVAILFQRPGAPGPSPGGPGPGAVAPAPGPGPARGAVAAPPVPVHSARASVTCFACGATTPAGKACASCGQPLMARRFCEQCGGPLQANAAFCEHCGARVPR